MRKQLPMTAMAGAFVLAAFSFANATEPMDSGTYDEPAAQMPEDQDMKDKTHGYDAPGPAQVDEDSKVKEDASSDAGYSHPYHGDKGLHERNIQEALDPPAPSRSQPSIDTDAGSDADIDSDM
jgi:hypothetical protein